VQLEHAFKNRWQEQGAVLITVCVFLIILSLVGIAAMDEALLQTKMSYHTRQKNQARTTAESGLILTQALFLKGSSFNCMQSWQGSAFYLQQSTTWWQSPNKCQAQFQQQSYAYFLSLIRTEPCFYQEVPLSPINKPLKKYGAEFYKLIVWAPSDNPQISSVLELNLVRASMPALLPNECAKEHKFTPGGLGWWILR